MNPNMRKKYMIPIDANDSSKRAAKFYLENLRKEDDIVYFIHVAEPTFSSPAVSLTKENPPALFGEMSESMQESLNAAKVLGQRYMSWAKEHNIESKAYVHVDSKTGHALMKVATEKNIDHIIVGSHGVNDIGRTVLGSVTNYIVHHATIPVTIVPCPLNLKGEVHGMRRFSLH